MSKDQANEIRDNIINRELSEVNVPINPFDLFNTWFEEAKSSEVPEPTAAILATTEKENHPSVRTILLKGVSKKGFIFYTNYNSRKAKELDVNPNASLLFLWKELQRQIRIEGIVEKVSRVESEEYFHSRPRESQIGAWASNQSSVIPNRKSLDDKFEEYRKKFGEEEIPLPDFWGGYILVPNYFEFWQGRPGRLHDRVCYKSDKDKWNIFRLSP